MRSVWLSDGMGWTFAALIAATVILWLLARQIRRWIRLRRHHGRLRRARRGEVAAVDVLEEAGFRVVESQVHGEWSVEVDGVPHAITVIADHLVERDGAWYVAEVKTGDFATRIETAATRRQMLEYLFAFEVDGILLVDMEEAIVREVRFPLSRPLPPA